MKQIFFRDGFKKSKAVSKLRRIIGSSNFACFIAWKTNRFRWFSHSLKGKENHWLITCPIKLHPKSRYDVGFAIPGYPTPDFPGIPYIFSRPGNSIPGRVTGYQLFMHVLAFFSSKAKAKMAFLCVISSMLNWQSNLLTFDSFESLSSPVSMTRLVG